MAIILDADVVIRGEKGTFDLKSWVTSRYLDAVLESLPIIPYTEQTAYEQARIWAELEVSGKMIGFYDLIVGATARERGGEVATFNKRRFGQIRGLTVIEPK
jgi:predicted nucleic acid-binding protein